MFSLRDQIEQLEHDLMEKPMRIAVYSEFPFAIFRYDPGREWDMRHEMRLLVVRLEQAGKRVHPWSMADLVWASLDKADAFDALVELEMERGFDDAESKVHDYLTDDTFFPVHRLMAERYKELEPARDIVFLWRVGALAPHMLRVSGLLERLHSNRAQLVPTVVFYPGGWRNGLSFMNIRGSDEALGSYRVKVYGREA